LKASWRTLGLLGLLVVFGCGKNTDGEGGAGAGGAAPSTPNKKGDRALAVARVGESKITVGQVEDELNKLHPSVRVRFSSPERRKDFVKNLVRFEVLAREARRRKLDKDPEVVKRVKRAMIDVMMDQLRSSLVKMEQITDSDVEAYYHKHIKLYRKPPKVRVSMIVTKTRGEAARLLAQAKKKAGDVGHFAELAAKHSIDPATKVRRGDVGFFAKDDTKVPPAIIEAAFSIDAMWTFAGPLKLDDKWAIVLKTGDMPGTNRPLEMERNRIRNRLYNERRLKAVEDFVKQLQESAKVEILEKNLAKVKTKDAPQPPASMMPR
jgi:parvulin-like peptidyl-prolyl isomerase